jgi:predicted Zn-dependent protease
MLVGLALAGGGCAGGGERRAGGDNYLRYVGFDLPFNENVYLRWSRNQMPLRVHLPAPPDGFYADPEAVLDVVRDGVTDWTDAAEPGLPSFVFVDTAREADIPIVWAFEPPDPSWYVAYCAYSPTLFTARQFAIDYILVTARWRGEEPSLDVLYETVLHETGHALGLGGHSPDPGDVMYAKGRRNGRPEVSERDRATLRALYAKPNGHRVTGPKRAD